jgi:polyphosphate glucokinase
MAPSMNPSLHEEVLAIDIGATNIKFCRVDSHGGLLESARRRPTPYPCSPDRLVELLSDRILHVQPRQIGVGFPGEFDDGHVIRPGNLSRPGGVTTEVDPDLEASWIGFPLQDTLCDVTDRDVRIVNDATLAAYGCVAGKGVEVVLTLGTGLGLALCVEGTMRKVRDVGAEVFRDGKTFDQLLGERSRASDEDSWLSLVHDTIEKFGQEFTATTVHLAGGNARRIGSGQFPDLAYRIVINGNQAPLHGAAKLFYG